MNITHRIISRLGITAIYDIACAFVLASVVLTFLSTGDVVCAMAAGKNRP